MHSMTPDIPPAVAEALREGRPLTAGEALELTALFVATPEALPSLAAAPAVRPGGERPAPFTCGIINAKSGRCSEDCAFCAQSRYHTTAAPVYPLLDRETLLARACRLAEHGVDRMGVVTSGAAPSPADLDSLCETARLIRERAGIGLCASLGALTPDKARRLRQAGFGSYHHNLETSDSFYPSICTTHAHETRRETVRLAREAGLRVCSGGLFGLGEGWRERVELSADLDSLGVDSIPVNFLMPVAGTRLHCAPPLSAAEGLGIVLLLRLMHPGRDIVLCGGRPGTLGEQDRLAFPDLANGLMVGDYLTEKGASFTRDLAMVREKTAWSAHV